jgi:hypothetical protein
VFYGFSLAELLRLNSLLVCNSAPSRRASDEPPGVPAIDTPFICGYLQVPGQAKEIADTKSRSDITKSRSYKIIRLVFGTWCRTLINR